MNNTSSLTIDSPEVFCDPAMPAASNGPKQADIRFALPRPSPDGVVEFMRVYYARYGKKIESASAEEALCSLMTIIYHVAVTEQLCSTMDSMLGSPTTTDA